MSIEQSGTPKSHIESMRDYSGPEQFQDIVETKLVPPDATPAQEPQSSTEPIPGFGLEDIEELREQERRFAASRRARGGHDVYES